MATDKVTLTLGQDTLAGARQAAAAAGQSLSAWVDHAARERLRVEGARALSHFMSSDEGRDIRAAMSVAAAHRAEVFTDTSP